MPDPVHFFFLVFICLDGSIKEFLTLDGPISSLKLYQMKRLKTQQKEEYGHLQKTFKNPILTEIILSISLFFLFFSRLFF